MTDLVMHTSADTAAAFLANADKDLFSVFVVRVTKSTPTFKHVKSADVEEADPRYASRLGGDVACRFVERGYMATSSSQR